MYPRKNNIMPKALGPPPPMRKRYNKFWTPDFGSGSAWDVVGLEE